MKDDVGKSLSNSSTGVKETYEDMVDSIKLKLQEDLVDEWGKMKTHFRVNSAHLEENTGDKSLCRSSDVESSLEKSRALL